MLQAVLRAGRWKISTLHRHWNSSGRQKVALLTPALLALLASLAIAACGGSGASARQLADETFANRHPIDSGILHASLTITPTGSSSLTGPIGVEFSGPFQSLGARKVPESDFTIAIHFQGHTGAISVLTTASAGYVILDGTAYQLPASSFRQLGTGVSSVGASGTQSSLSRLGIRPERWLSNPEVVGTAQVNGASTEHIHGQLALGPLLGDLSTLLTRASKVNATASNAVKSITPADRTKIEGEVRDASFDLWTGSADHTLRRLDVAATLPVGANARRELGGLTSARLALSFGYSDVGRPQTITAPTATKPYAQFRTDIGAIVEEIESEALQYAESSASGTAGSGGSGSSSFGQGGNSAYSRCTSAAGTSVAKLQKCAALLNSGG